jgi:lipopolysaccharide/colanic/teichoic acid biosynthesis glycosyltransferase
MILVGPRPLVIDPGAQVVGLARGRRHLTPGMTGPGQVLGMRADAGDGRYRLPVRGHWSLWRRNV